jgi:hypothetical protein
MLRKRPELFPLALAFTLLIALAVTGAPNGVPFDELWAAIGDLEDAIDDLQGASAVPGGTIAMWSGAIADIPDGWALCDGSNGTPDLADRFIMGVSDGKEPGGQGGAASHAHTIPAGGPFYVVAPFSGGGGVLVSPVTHTHYMDASGHLPPYYRLAFIMKL